MEEQNLNEMLLVRRQKLHDLVDAGKDPHEIEKFEGAIYSKEIKDNYDNTTSKSYNFLTKINIECPAKPCA